MGLPWRKVNMEKKETKPDGYIDCRPVNVNDFTEEEILEFLLQEYSLEELKACGLYPLTKPSAN